MRLRHFLRLLRQKQFFATALAGSACLALPYCSAKSAAPQRTVDTRTEDVEQRSGPYAIAGQNYTVVLHEKRLPGVSDTALGQTLAGIEIRDAVGNVAYQRAFSYAVEKDYFERSLSAAPRLASGKTGAGLVIRYSERTARTKTGELQTHEFWQLFGLVNGKLAPLGKPVPIGSTSGPYMGVVMKAVNGGVTVVSQPDVVELRVWTGYFYVFVPLRVDWNHGGLAQGQRCMEMLGGGLKEAGCEMRVEANWKPSTEEFTFLRLFVDAHENFASAEHVVLQKDSKFEILGASAITAWKQNEDVIQPDFSDLWLHVRIGDRTGWIHGEEDFAAAGLSSGSPAP